MSSTSVPVLPPIVDRFITSAIDFNFKHNAEQPFYIFSDPTAPSGIQVINHLEFGRAAHRIAHALRADRSGPDGRVVGIIALSDTILYQAFIVGCIIAGLVPFPISPRLSPAAVVNLLEKTSCHRLIATTVTLKSLLDDIRGLIAATPFSNLLQIEEVPSLGTAYPNLGHELAGHPFERFLNPLKSPSKDDLCIYLHSSGSTGFPKAIPQTYQAMMQWATFPPVVDFRPGFVIGCMALPSFHVLGIYGQFFCPIFGLLTISVYPPTASAIDLFPVIPSPQNILEQMKLTKAMGLMSIPMLLQVWSQSPEAIKFLANLSYVGYSGGSLTPRLGNILVNAGIHVYPLYGATEFGAVTRMVTSHGEDKDWELDGFIKAMELSSVKSCLGKNIAQWSLTSAMLKDMQPPMSLCLIQRVKISGKCRSLKLKQVYNILMHIDSVGRIDDVIVHSSGEKTVPAPMENIVLSSPLVQAVLMFGREHDRTGILIEPKLNNSIDVNDHTELAILRNKLWPIVEEANTISPAFSRIFKEMILITPAENPLPQSGKGTVMRKAALVHFNKEIEELYNTVNSNVKTSTTATYPASWTLPDVQSWFVAQAADLISGAAVSPLVNLFEQGFDSLNATFLRIRIIRALRSSDSSSAQKAAEGLSQNLVYSYPIIRDLSAHIVFLLSSSQAEVAQSDESSRRASVIEEMIEKYSYDLSGASPTTGSPQPSPAVILLTGSTGNLGSEILAALLKNAKVEHIYALNRHSQELLTTKERHLRRLEERGLATELLNTGKVSYLIGDTTQSNLGLSHGQYSELSRSVNIIIHNAWKVDFNLSLSAFESNIQGTRHLIDLLKSGPNAADGRFLFTSSISSAQNWPRSNGLYPEEIVMNASFSVGGGYGEGKYIAERILAQSGLHTTSLRIGQVSGGKPKGAWPATEWVPILVKSSITIGSLPDIKGLFSWVPMDVVASSIVGAALGNETLPQVVNLVHPRPCTATEVIAHLQAAIKKVLGQHLRIIPFPQWLTTIETQAKDATAKTLVDIPAIKLLEFFQSVSRANNDIISSGSQGNEAGGLPLFSTHNMLRVSHDTLSDLESIGIEDVSRWVVYWQEMGVFMN
ncbi:putative NRPS-like protein biosynthetic cluster [Tephrocybe rancida]|nr:putative NRPS-like protein biosynthetic cluster [Tephrocybe rancida]